VFSGSVRYTRKKKRNVKTGGEKLVTPEMFILTVLLGISHCLGQAPPKLGAEIRNGIPQVRSLFLFIENKTKNAINNNHFCHALRQCSTAIVGALYGRE
jgi:hypothetical protein